MFLEIKNKVEKEILQFIKSLDRSHSLRSISPILYSHIHEFISRKGKRIRPILFTVGYLGFARKPALGLYRSAVSLELLHDFMLVHDDIIDKSAMRRGSPAMHTLLNKYLSGKKGLKFTGEDLAIVVGDVMYAMALEAFLSVKEDMHRKEAAFKKLIEAAFYTGSGEFIEVLIGMKDIAKISKQDIYKVYDLKTANYTFASPLTIGATLAGAGKKQIDLLSRYGITLGRAFQIKDDIIGTFNDEAETGKPNLTDIQEGKKTLLIWYAYTHSNTQDKRRIKKIFSKRIVNQQDLGIIRRIIEESGALAYAKKEVDTFLAAADTMLASSAMKPAVKKELATYTNALLNL